MKDKTCLRLPSAVSLRPPHLERSSFLAPVITDSTFARRSPRGQSSLLSGGPDGRGLAADQSGRCGALPLPNHAEKYARLVELGLCQVIGFEPTGDTCRELNDRYGPPHLFLPHFVGDGKPGEFRLCNYPMTSSLYEPNYELLDKFQALSEFTQVVERSQVETTRLDDIPEVADIDFLKMDVQGAECDILSGAAQSLRSAVAVYTEVMFVPMYKDQPLFADVDQSLRNMGFMLHGFDGISGRAFQPFFANNNPYETFNQAIWANAMYVKDFTALSCLSDDQLVKMAMILHEVFGSYDLAHLCLMELDQRRAEAIAQTYCNRLIAA